MEGWVYPGGSLLSSSAFLEFIEVVVSWPVTREDHGAFRIGTKQRHSDFAAVSTHALCSDERPDAYELFCFLARPRRLLRIGIETRSD